MSMKELPFLHFYKSEKRFSSFIACNSLVFYGAASDLMRSISRKISH